MEHGEEERIGIEMPEWDGSWGDEREILRRADEEGTREMSFYDRFKLSIARKREEARLERGIEPLWQPREKAEPEEQGEKPVRNIPLGPPKRRRG